MTVMNSAGPHFVSLVWIEYLGMLPGPDEVRILMQEEYVENSWSFFTKEQGGTWNHWDTRSFQMGRKPHPLFLRHVFLGNRSGSSLRVVDWMEGNGAGNGK